MFPDKSLGKPNKIGVLMERGLCMFVNGRCLLMQGEMIFHFGITD